MMTGNVFVFSMMLLILCRVVVFRTTAGAQRGNPRALESLKGVSEMCGAFFRGRQPASVRVSNALL
jgi:hypothetical protein